MAKVTNPLMSNEARGKFAGLVYNTWRGMSTVKVFKAPVKAKTALQLAIMAKMTVISKQWALITAAQRAAWTTYADNHLKTDWTGNPVRTTGANQFSSCAMLASLAGATPTYLADPPVLPSPISSIATVVGGTRVLSITHTTPTTAIESIDVRWRAGDSQGRQRAINEVQHSVMFLSNSAATYTLDAAATPGKATVFHRTVGNTTGLAGPWTKHEVTVSA
jgi:hypothetical protein